MASATVVFSVKRCEHCTRSESSTDDSKSAFYRRNCLQNSTAVSERYAVFVTADSLGQQGQGRLTKKQLAGR